jgi:hypothetical protein
LKIGWPDLNNVQEAGQYPFRDGMITVLELEIAIWRKHPNALFTLMRKNPIRQGVEYVLGTPEFSSENWPDMMTSMYLLNLVPLLVGIRN